MIVYVPSLGNPIKCQFETRRRYVAIIVVTTFEGKRSARVDKRSDTLAILLRHVRLWGGQDGPTYYLFDTRENIFLPF